MNKLAALAMGTETKFDTADLANLLALKVEFLGYVDSLLKGGMDVEEILALIDGHLDAKHRPLFKLWLKRHLGRKGMRIVTK